MMLIKKLTNALVLSAMLTSCASFSKEFYSISYDAFDVPGVTILDYQYTKGTKVIFGVDDSIKANPKFKGVFGLGTTGNYDVGDKLFVKWKINSTNEIKSDIVDLTKIMPSRMEDKKLTFIIDNDKLNIYIAGPTLEKQSQCTLRGQEYRASITADSAAKLKHCRYHLVKIYPEVKTLLD